MKKIVHKPAAPLYAAAAAWVLYALLFPLYRPGHFVIALAASAVVYGIARLFCKDIVEEVPQEPKTTGTSTKRRRSARPAIRSWTRWYLRARGLWTRCAA